MNRIVLAVIAAVSSNVVLGAEPGAYVSASVGYAKQKLSIEDFGSVSDNDTGYQVAAGYRFTPNLGVEAGYTSFGKASATEDGVTGSVKPESFYAALTGSYNITPGFAITGKVGVARNSTKFSLRDGTESESVKAKQTSAVFGIGASYSLTPNVAVIGEFQHFGKVVKEDGFNLKAQIVSVGVRYSF